MKKVLLPLLGAVMAVMMMAVFPASVLADSVTPDSYETTLGVGESVTIAKTVTITREAPTTAYVDVFFLTDSTGSMGGQIAAVKASAGGILTAASALGDVAFGVGEYRDIGDVFTYRTNQDITTDTVAVQAGIDAWSASGGANWPEANMYALEEVATTASWRDDSTRILVWFGDAPGHDPSAGGSTEVSATAALVAEGIVVQAIDVGYLDDSGQATRIAAATSGDYYSGVSTDDIVDVISDSILDVFNEYGEVSLDAVGNLPGVDVAIDPAFYAGFFDRSVERTFDFYVTFTGLVAGDHMFVINALVDGGIVAVERDLIHVSSSEVPEPATMLLLGFGLIGMIGFKKKRTSHS